MTLSIFHLMKLPNAISPFKVRYKILYLWKFIETCTMAKGLNFISNAIEYKRLTPRLKTYPPQLVIDITNICNLACPLCPTGIGLVNRRKGIMDVEFFAKLLDFVKTKSLAVHLYNWGEPLLVKSFVEYCRIAKSRGFVVSTSSNLSLRLSPAMVTDIIRSGLDRLIVSFDGLSEKNYLKYRIKGNYELVMQNLKLLIDSRKSLRTAYPLIVLQLVRHRGNDEDGRLLGRFARKIGADSFQVVDALLPFGAGDDRREIDRWVTSDRLHPKADKFDIREYELGKPCAHLWRYPVINHDGAIAPCCYVFDARDDFATISNRDFISAWNSPKYIVARNLFAEKHDSSPLPCHSCTLYHAYVERTKSIRAGREP